jgi:flagellar hook assembly protein FlgD
LQVWVEIYDISGKKINTLLGGELPGGYYNTTWNGDNNIGSKVNKGVYFYRIRTVNGIVITDKIVVL